MLLRVALAVLLLGCGDDDVAVDAGADLGVDLGRDAGTDGGPTDAAADQGRRDLGPEDPGWVSIWDDLPATCALERATHPERVMRFSWASCGDGCSYLMPDPVLKRRAPVPLGWTDGDDGRFVFRAESADANPAESTSYVLVAQQDGPLEALRREPRVGGEFCTWGALAGFGSEFAATAFVGRTEEDFEWRPMRATFGGPLVHEVVVPGEETPVSGFQGGALSAELYVAEVQPLGQVFAFSDGTMTAMGGALGDAPGIPSNALAISDTVVWETWGGSDIGLAYGRMDLQGAEYLAIDGVRIIGTAADPATNMIAWTQGYGYLGTGQYERIELWAASFTADPADLVPRLVREVPPYQSTEKLDGGYYVRFREEDRGFDLFDIVTGENRRVPPVDGFAFRGAFYVTSTEVALAAGFAGTDTTIVRFQLDSLPVVE